MFQLPVYAVAVYAGRSIVFPQKGGGDESLLWMTYCRSDVYACAAQVVHAV